MRKQFFSLLVLTMVSISAASVEGVWKGRLVAVQNAQSTTGGVFKDPEIILTLQPKGKCVLMLSFDRYNKTKKRNIKVNPIEGTWRQSGGKIMCTLTDPMSKTPIGEFMVLNLSKEGKSMTTDVKSIPKRPGQSASAPVYQAVLKKG